MTQRLNQVLAVERNIKSRAHSELTELHKATQKGSLFEGFTRNYSRRDDAQEELPAEKQLVQKRCDEVLKHMSRLLSEQLDVILSKDSANQRAKADVVVGGKVLAKDVPATTLIALEKQLNDVHTFVEKLPVLDPAHRWTFDEALGIWQSEPQTTTRTKKVQKALVLLAPTEKHPGQAQQITEDEVVGTWTSVKQSGAMKASDKEAILERIQKLQKAVKFAREAANTVDAPDRNMGEDLFNFILGR